MAKCTCMRWAVWAPVWERPARTLHNCSPVAQRPREHQRRHPSGDPPPRCVIEKHGRIVACLLNRTQGPAALL